ncbi:MAG: AMP-binding protein [Gemmataceae bacterium]
MLERQRDKLRRLLAALIAANVFYGRKLVQTGINEPTEDAFRRLPPTTKHELLADQEVSPPYGTNLTYPLERYVRLHQTSGTKGTPLRWLDTQESWDWMLGCWRRIFALTGVKPGDRLFFPFSFGPFLGFWTAFEAATRLGCLCIAAGGMSTKARLRLLVDNEARVMLCTPTYALHLAEAAAQEGIAIRGALNTIIVAGEPGGSIPATRERIEEAWGARLFDHSGMTEVGPMTIGCVNRRGCLHVLEEDYLAETLDPNSLQPTPEGEIGELCVTNLGRIASPVLRYRTGDLVRVSTQPCPCGLPYLTLEGGILGRVDDMIAIRGNNFFPSALENVLRRFPEIGEYQVRVDTSSPLAELRVEIETSGHDEALPARVRQTIRDELFFRADVTLATPGSLPRYEMKAKRVIVQ